MKKGCIFGEGWKGENNKLAGGLYKNIITDRWKDEGTKMFMAAK